MISPQVHLALSLVGTEHAVGFIALSHLSEHFKEYLESQDHPRYHVEERTRIELLRIFTGTPCVAWPAHVLYYHEKWDRLIGDLDFKDHMPEHNQKEVMAELERADKASAGGHH